MFGLINHYGKIIMFSTLTIIVGFLIIGGYSHVWNSENDPDALKTIRMASIIFRHGERNPESSFPTDPNINYKWPGGYGALVPKGALNLINVGKKLRTRYSKLIPVNGYYHQNVIKVMSSEFERCLMSGESFLAGFMPPPKTSNILPISWQPIPIYTIPRQYDYYIFQLAPCPEYDELYKSFRTPQNEFYNETYAQYADVLETVTYYTGTNFSISLQIEGLYTTFEIQQSAGLEIPEWTKNIYPARLLEIVKISSRFITKTPWMKKMKGGPLLTQILDNMSGKRKNTLEPDRSLFIYSGHDITLKNVINTIGVMSQTGEIPGFGATLVFELHDNELFGNDDFEIRIIYYNDGYAKIPIDINIPNCEKPCSLGNFTQLMEPYIIRNVEEVCKTNSKLEL